MNPTYVLSPAAPEAGDQPPPGTAWAWADATVDALKARTNSAPITLSFRRCFTTREEYTLEPGESGVRSAAPAAAGACLRRGGVPAVANQSRVHAADSPPRLAGAA